MKKMNYEKPQMYAETFIANQYVAACTEPMYNVTPTDVRCQSQGHTNTQYITMFTDQQSACVAIFVPNVGSADGDVFHTQFEACSYVVGCNRRTWNASHPNDADLSQHKSEHASSRWANDGAFINHDTTIDLSLAEKFNLS